MNVIIERVMNAISALFQQIMMILDLQTQNDSVETRFKRLRFIYYGDEKVHIGYRRVREVLRGRVAEDYHTYYEQMLSAERATQRLIKNLHSGARGEELLEQMQRLSEKTAHLIEQLQSADEIQKLYAVGNTQHQTVQESRAWLMERIEEALDIQTGIPARVISFKTVATGRGVDKLSERIARLAQRLDDIAESYAELDEYTPANVQRLIQENLSTPSDEEYDQ